MIKWTPWKSVLAGAVIGFVDAAGSTSARRGVRRPRPVVRFEDGAGRVDPHPGLWFLDPLEPPVPLRDGTGVAGLVRRLPAARLMAHLARQFGWPAAQ